jgi:nitrite reductase/ring-hydroxylating ferredoxin subunit
VVPQWRTTTGERISNYYKAAVLPSSFTKLCHLGDLKDGAALGFDPLAKGQDTLFVVRQGPVLRSYKNDCPHWPGSPMAWRKDAYLTSDGSHIACHGHGAQFDIASGRCISGPCEGQSLQSLELKIDESGHVFVRLEHLSGKTVIKNKITIADS